MAGKSTLNRLAHAPAGEPTRYHKIGHDGALIERLFVDLFLDAHRTPPAEIGLDLDATDDPLHGSQEGRFFHGYYGGYGYLPLDVCCGDHLLAELAAARTEAAQTGKAARCCKEVHYRTLDTWSRERAARRRQGRAAGRRSWRDQRQSALRGHLARPR